MQTESSAASLRYNYLKSLKVSFLSVKKNTLKLDFFKFINNIQIFKMHVFEIKQIKQIIYLFKEQIFIIYIYIYILL